MSQDSVYFLSSCDDRGAVSALDKLLEDSPLIKKGLEGDIAFSAFLVLI